MDDRSRRSFDLWAPGIASGVIVVTAILTYGTGVLAHCRGSLLVYFAWLSLAASAVCGLFLSGGSPSRTLRIARNIGFFLGLVSLGFAVYLNAHAKNMFKGWPGS